MWWVEVVSLSTFYFYCHLLVQVGSFSFVGLKC